MTKILCFAFVVSSTAFAGNRVGNGGDVVVCPDKIQLLDLYESVGMTEPEISGKYEEILKDRIKILTKLAPKLGAQYERRRKTIEGEFDFKPDVVLTNVKDSKHSFLPAQKDCKLNQIVIRKSEIVEGREKRFVVDEGLWKKLSDVQKAGLIFHEIVYEHFAKLQRDQDDIDSRKARKFNALVFSKEFDTMTDGKFWVFMKDLAIPIYP